LFAVDYKIAMIIQIRKDALIWLETILAHQNYPV